MTREEAIKGLKVLAKDFSGYRPNEEMFNMAIKALEQPEPCEDTISRQMAIAEIARWIGYIDEDMILRIQTGLKKLPSAQPEQQWIPVSERLPEELTTVLITDKDVDVFLATLIGVINGRAEWTTDGIVAWMPLPEAYKEGENE